MPAVNDELEILYDDRVLGGSTDYLIIDNYKIEPTYPKATLEFNLLVNAASHAALITALAALDTDVFRKPRGRVRVRLGGTVRYDWDPSTNTGFNAKVEASETEGELNTGLSREFKVKIEVELPADLTGQAGRVDSKIEVDHTPAGRRTITLEGEYTAQTGPVTALAQYEAEIGTYEDAIKALIDNAADWERATRKHTHDDTNKRIAFVSVIDEIIFDQSSGVRNDSELFGQKFTMKVRELAPGDSPQRGAGARGQNGGDVATRPSEVTISYSVWVAKSVTDLKGKWRTKIRPHIEAQFRAITTVPVLLELEPEYDFVENRISASGRGLSLGGSAFLELKVEVDDDRKLGSDIREVWDGDPLSAHVLPGHALFLRTITTTSKKYGSPPPPLPDNVLPPPLDGWVPLAQKQRSVVEKEGLSPFSVRVYRTVLVEAYRRVKKPAGAAVRDPANATFSGLGFTPPVAPGSGSNG